MENKETGNYDESGLLQVLSDTYCPLHYVQIVNPEHILKPDGKTAVITVPSKERHESFHGLYDAYILIDFGREVIGYPRIKLKGIEGGIVDCAYSERLIGGKVAPYLQTVKYIETSLYIRARWRL